LTKIFPLSLELIASLANGKVLTGRDMFVTEAVQASAIDATVKSDKD
jgi:hypothetical protein